MASVTDAAARERYRLRATALKWCLVTSFGYLGYKNARFGKIEAHECTTALGREVLLQAKELAEGKGFRVLHAMTDALWVHREGAGTDDYRLLAEAITEATGLPALLEGVYWWIAFVPSKTDPTQGVPNRFYGVFRDGSMKVRGLEVRRGDMPRFVKEFQGELLALFARARTKAEYEALIPQALERLREALTRLREGRVPIEALAVRKRLSKEPLKYEKASPTAIAAQELLARGGTLYPGEKVALVHTDERAKLPEERVKALASWDGARSYDPAPYERLLLEAAEAVLIYFGIDDNGRRPRVEFRQAGV